jgi:MarR family transcriptional regulator, lower aerobic nicotinate degradation pathway regulator
MGRGMKSRSARAKPRGNAYILDEQVGFILRLANQRHTAIFADRMGADITPTQWAALVKLHEVGPTSQNQLGRMTAMDVANIKGVVDRLLKRGLIATMADVTDARRRLVVLSGEGRALLLSRLAEAKAITEETLSPLSPAERAQFLALLGKLC